MSAKLTEQLRKAIRESGLERSTICKRAGLDKTALSRFLNGERGLSIPVLDALCKLLGLELVKRKTARGKGEGK